MSIHKICVPLSTTLRVIDMILDELRFGSAVLSTSVDTHIDHQYGRFVFVLHTQFNHTEKDLQTYVAMINNKLDVKLEIC